MDVVVISLTLDSNQEPAFAIGGVLNSISALHAPCSCGYASSSVYWTLEARLTSVLFPVVPSLLDEDGRLWQTNFRIPVTLVLHLHCAKWQSVVC